MFGWKTQRQRIRDQEAQIGLLMERCDRLTDDLAAVAEALGEIERPVRDLEAEWTSMYEKMRTLHMRLAKREKRDEEAADAPEEPKPNGARETRNPAAMRLLGRL